MDEKLNEILQAFVSDFIEKQRYDYVLKENSEKVPVVTTPIPIVWFGDLEKYWASEKKIVTVALNPSYKEFTEKRFDSISFERGENSSLLPALQNTLNSYFGRNPYLDYFNQYEWLVQLFQSSYFVKSGNTAIHIDAHSAFATYPNWGDLDKRLKDDLKSSNLFKTLFEYLNPDITLISIAQNDFDELFPWKSNWEIVAGKEIHKGVYVYFYRRGKQLMIHGRNFRGTPFGGATHEEYTAAIKKLLNEISL